MIREKIASLDEINSRIMSFNYGQLDSEHRPSIINLDKDHLGLGGLQILNLFLRFNYMFDDYKTMKEMIEKLKLISVVTKIHQIISSTSFDETRLDELDKFVDEFFNSALIHLKEWDKILKKFKPFNLTPKCHNLRHYKMVIKKLGPVNLMSTLRYECKHRFIKSLASTVKMQDNFLNYAFTRHQEEWALEWSNTIEMAAMIFGKATDATIDTLPESFLNHSIKRVTWVDGLYSYAPGYFIFHSEHFYQIQDIYKLTSPGNEDVTLFKCRIARTSFDSFYNGYEIIEIEIEDILLQMNELTNLMSFDSIVSRKTAKSYVLLKNCI